MSTAFLPEMTPELKLLSPAPGTAEPLRAAAAVLDPALPLPNRGAMSAPAKAPACRRAVRRRARLDWEAVAVILLMLACAAVGVYRLIWMGQI